jgi:hypothetical protein
VILAAAAGAFLWANAVESPGVQRVPAALPAGNDFLVQLLFTRGWPLSPWRLCPRHGGRFHPESFIWETLVVDGLLAFDALFLAAYFSEWALQRMEKGEKG